MTQSIRKVSETISKRLTMRKGGSAHNKTFMIQHGLLLTGVVLSYDWCTHVYHTCTALDRNVPSIVNLPRKVPYSTWQSAFAPAKHALRKRSTRARQRRRRTCGRIPPRREHILADATCVAALRSASVIVRMVVMGCGYYLFHSCHAVGV